MVDAGPATTSHGASTWRCRRLAFYLNLRTDADSASPAAGSLRSVFLMKGKPRAEEGRGGAGPATTSARR
jgi:hypothetical protein